MWIVIILSLIIHIALALLVANMANEKGYGGGAFFVISFFFSFIVALIVVLCLPDKFDQKNQHEELIGAIEHNTQSHTNNMDELEKAHDLLQKGAITEEEYKTIKDSILKK